VREATATPGCQRRSSLRETPPLNARQASSGYGRIYLPRSMKAFNGPLTVPRYPWVTLFTDARWADAPLGMAERFPTRFSSRPRCIEQRPSFAPLPVGRLAAYPSPHADHRASESFLPPAYRVVPFHLRRQKRTSGQRRTFRKSLDDRAPSTRGCIPCRRTCHRPSPSRGSRIGVRATSMPFRCSTPIPSGSSARAMWCQRREPSVILSGTSTSTVGKERWKAIAA